MKANIVSQWPCAPICESRDRHAYESALDIHSGAFLLLAHAPMGKVCSILHSVVGGGLLDSSALSTAIIAT